MQENRTQDAAAALSAHSKDAAGGPAPASQGSPDQTAAPKPPGGAAGAPSGGVQAGAGATGSTISETARNVGASASEMGGRAYDTVSETARNVGASASEMGGRAYQQATRAGEYASEAVRRQPLPSVLIGVGLGFILGYLANRHR